MRGLTFYANDSVGLRRRKEVRDRDGKTRTQEDTLQFKQITDVPHESKGGRRGAVTVLGGFLALVGILGIALVIVAVSASVPTLDSQSSAVVILPGFSLLLGILLMARKKTEGYFQVLSPLISSKELQDWQFIDDKNGKNLRKFVLERLGGPAGSP